MAEYYRVEQKSWGQVARSVLLNHSLAMPGWSSAKQSLFTSGDSTLVYKCSFSSSAHEPFIEHGSIETNELKHDSYESYDPP